ncbi:MAG TPA: hypothetical protein VGQ59_18095 [Cyclobacteriaceae bacterium]|jgi:hypothetical protein|nr:hypothetical protein [Cyclobacteriaceae bacterium]
MLLIISFRTFCLDAKSTKKIKAEGCFRAPAYAPPRPSACPALLGLLNMFRESLSRILSALAGKKAGECKQERKEHLFALSFLVLFSTKEKRTKKED